MPSIDHDETGRITTDLNCVGCGYNLRGLDADSTCPECGVVIGRSLRGGLLELANPNWVGRLARAMNVALFVLEFGVICVVPFVFLWWNIFDGTVGDWAIVVTIVGVPTAIGLIACWMFSTKEMNATEVETSPNWRLIARWSAVSLVVLVAVELTLIRFAGEHREWWWFPEVVTCGIGVATVGVFTAGRYAVGLARRVPDEALARRTSKVSLGCTAIGALATSGLCLLLLVAWLPDLPILREFHAGDGIIRMATVLLIFGGLVTFVVFLWFGSATIGLMYRFRKALRDAAKKARAAWVSDLK